MPKNIQLRRLGQDGPLVSPMGLGGWTMGGPFFSGEGCRYPTGHPLGWGEVDDSESIRAIHCALDCGITLFDTADAYGTGRGERVLGQALKGRRDKAVIATKFGNTYDEAARELTGSNASPAYIRQACQASLARLDSGWIDLYQLHIGDLAIERAADVAETLEELCDEGLVRYYGWSTDDPARAAAIAPYPRAVAIQHDMNLFDDAPAMLTTTGQAGLAGIARSPLAMGFLSGRFTGESRLAEDDIRATPPDWLRYFEPGGSASANWLARLEAVREILTSEGRSLTQGALAWIWARGPHTIPIPGARTEAQVRENAGAMAFGPLGPEQMAEIAGLLDMH